MLSLIHTSTHLMAAEAAQAALRTVLRGQAAIHIEQIRYDLKTKPHVKALGHSHGYPVRNLCNPPNYTDDIVLQNDRSVKAGGWADPADVTVSGFENRPTFEMQGIYLIDPVTRAPRNPRGQTGIDGRGKLGKWGPNHAADPIVTAYHPTKPGVLQVVVIRRGDTGECALPGGMVDDGETVSVTLKREFAEEAGNVDKEDKVCVCVCVCVCQIP